MKISPLVPLLLAMVSLYGIGCAYAIAFPNSDSTDLDVDVPEIIEVTAAAAISMPDVTTMPECVEVDDTTFSVKSNVDWDMNALGTDSGHMMCDSPSEAAENALKAKWDGPSGTGWQDLDGSGVGLANAIQNGEYSNNMHYKQCFGWNDDAGTYTITVTMAVSADV